jgi:hypothetical protein
MHPGRYYRGDIMVEGASNKDYIALTLQEVTCPHPLLILIFRIPSVPSSKVRRAKRSDLDLSPCGDFALGGLRVRGQAKSGGHRSIPINGPARNSLLMKKWRRGGSAYFVDTMERVRVAVPGSALAPAHADTVLPNQTCVASRYCFSRSLMRSASRWMAHPISLTLRRQTEG